MPVYRANAIVLRRINFGETDRILTVYSREHGKLSAIAKGSRRPVSKLAASSELFTYAKYLLATGSNLDVLTQSETRESFPGIRGDIHKIAYATYMVELLNATVEDHDPNPDIFDTLLSSLYLLEGGVDAEIVTRACELQVMAMSGYRPNLESCARCGSPAPKDRAGFSPSYGGVVCEMCGMIPDDTIAVSAETLKAMTALLTAEPTQLRDMNLSDEVRDEMANIMRWHIRYRLERELKSAEFIQALKAGAQ